MFLKRGQGEIMILILFIVVIIETIFLYNNYYQPAIAKNYILGGEIESVKREVTAVKRETKFISLKDFDVGLRWKDFRLNEDPKYLYWNRCEGNNAGDIVVNVGVKGLSECLFNDANCPEYSCFINLLKGENREFYSDVPNIFKISDYSRNTFIEKPVAFDQRLDVEHEIEICCTSGHSESRFCMKKTLNAYC